MPARAPGPDIVPALARLDHDRQAYRRRDEQWLDHAWTRSRVFDVRADATAPVAWRGDEAALQLRRPADGERRQDAVFLGTAGEEAFFAVIEGNQPADPAPDPGSGSAGGVRWVGLREAGPVLSDRDAGLLTAAVALGHWRRTHRHCPRCGTATEPVDAGWGSRCPRDGSLHFPRTDAAVIMLVHDGGERCVLGRQASWPDGRFSILAGFVEAGESLEAAVAREVDEEVGLAVTDVTYLASQPWPFPASLMVGFTARVTGSQVIARRDDELAEADWFTKAEVRAAAEAGERGVPDPSARLRMSPFTVSIAAAILRDWITR
ncbi:MAG: NAD(+) diphosphatase [bacterium]